MRSELGQASWVVRRHPPHRVRTQAEVVRRMALPPLPPRRAGRGLWAVGVVRDEVDVVGHTVRHLLRQGVDHVLLADNGSVDGTLELLETLAGEDARVHLARDAHPAHHQAEKVTYLAHTAWRHGARWVIPVDADELHFAADGTVADLLDELPHGIVHADFHHMVAVDAGAPLGPTSAFLLDSTPSFPGKVVARAHPLLAVGPGPREFDLAA